jgi:hypothetical protein
VQAGGEEVAADVLVGEVGAGTVGDAHDLLGVLTGVLGGGYLLWRLQSPAKQAEAA